MEVGPFLKEFVKREAVAPGFLRSGSAWANRLSLSVGHGHIAGRRRRPGFERRLGCRRRGKLQSFLSSAIAPNTFLRRVPPAIAVGGSARSSVRADADLSSANSSP